MPALHRGDAIGDSALLMRDAFRAWGLAADVYTLEVDDELASHGRPSSAGRPGGPDDVVILHYALPSPLSAALREMRGRRVLLHHNITPPAFFAGYDPELARICALGQRKSAAWLLTWNWRWATASGTVGELEQAGFVRTGVLPI